MKLASLIASGLLAANGLAQVAPLPWVSPGDGLPGDHPPQPVYAFTGNAGVSWDVAGAQASGQLTITDVPSGARIERAFFVTGIWCNAGSPSCRMAFTFNGQPYGIVQPATMDPGSGAPLDLASFLVDVTSQVTGNATYAFIASPQAPGTGPWGSLLLVVYESQSVPRRKIALAFGGDSLQNATSETVLPGFQAGPAVLQLFTEADQAGASNGTESILLDGATVAGGPGSDIFCNNQVWATSFFELPVTLAGASPRIGVVTGEDWFGWHAALVMQATSEGDCGRIGIAPKELPYGTVGTGYSVMLTASGGTPPYAFSASDLPPGLALGRGGLLHGWPSLAGTYRITVKVVDAGDCRKTRSYDLVIGNEGVQGSR